MAGVGDSTADGLGVADVAVGAQHPGHCVASLRAAAKLLDSALVDVAADGDGNLGLGGHVDMVADDAGGVGGSVRILCVQLATGPPRFEPGARRVSTSPA